MKTLKQLKRLFLLFFLIVAGVQCAWAWTNHHADVQDIQINGVTYQLCYVYSREASSANYGYHEDTDPSILWPDEYYASIVGITGSGEIEIPEAILDGGVKYVVKYFGYRTEQQVRSEEGTYTDVYTGLTWPTTCYYYTRTLTPVSINASNVTKLTFKGNVIFKGNFTAASCTSMEFKKDVTISSDLSCSQLTKFVFEGNFNYTKDNEPYLKCSNLTQIYFKGTTPTLSGSWSQYSTRAANYITVYLNESQEECNNLHTYATVWSEFMAVVPYSETPNPETVNVNVKVEASAPLDYFITDYFWLRLNYGEYDDLYGNQSASFTLNKHDNFFFEMENQEDPIWGIMWNPIAVYVNGKDRTEDIEYDMTTYFEVEDITSDTEIRVVFGPDCNFVSVVSLGPDLLWERFDGEQQLIDCAAEHYYVPVSKYGDPVVIKTNLLPNQTPENYDVMYMNNYGRYDLEQPDMDFGGVELTSDQKNFQFMLFPNVKDQDRVIGIYPKATGTVPVEGTKWTVLQTGGFEGAEMVVTANGEDETISCTEASTTQALSDDVTKVRLVVPVANNQPYQVKLEDCGSQKLAVIKLIKETQGLTLADAKALANAAPIMLTGYENKDDALNYASQLKALGATAEALAVKVYCDGVDVTSELTTSDNMTYIEKTSEELVTTNWIINSEILMNRFDTNEDGTINISDVTKLVNKILEQSPN